ncbi:DNA cytosine methyltransferase, partial [Candidatus Pacearchaeota archaeon]|nr:DNA cytosine methyltransferase [Candidatus Pacearchaeota archaeon]
GTDDPRHLWPYIEQHIGTIEPLWCFFENVGGHLSLGFEEVAQSLRDMGYQVEAGLFTAAEVGAPHKRQRLFILGYTRSCGQYWIARRGTNKVATDRHCELAYPQSQRCGKAGASGKRQEERDIRTSSMADSERPESGAGTLEGSQTGIRGPRSPINSTELAHTAGERTQGYEPEGHDSTEGQADELRYNRWPARPGEVQQYWEEPRTVESGMGRTVDGFRSRVDELRLLGNGVVPQQTELAFRTLIERKMTWTG